MQIRKIASGTALSALATLAAGCSTAPRVDPFLARADITGTYAFPPAGFVRAREDEIEGKLEGDNVKLQRDLETEGAFGWGASIDVCPTLNDEARVSYRRIGAFDGDAVLGRPRRYDGQTYLAGEHVTSAVAWQSLNFSAAHRILALGNPQGPTGPFADVLLRAGIEACTFDSRIDGAVTPREKRQVRAGAPFVGLEGRAHVMPRTTFEHSLLAGYWNHDGSSLKIIDGTAGFRVRIAGPLDLLLRYEFILRDARASFSDGELSRLELQTHAVSAGVALRF